VASWVAISRVILTICLFAISACSPSGSKSEAPIQISIEIEDQIIFTSENVSDEDIILPISEGSVSRPEDNYKFAGHLMYMFKDCDGNVIDTGFGAGWWTVLGFESQIYSVAEEVFPKGYIRTKNIVKGGAGRAEHACEGKYQLSYYLTDGQIIAKETDWIKFEKTDDRE